MPPPELSRNFQIENVSEVSVIFIFGSHSDDVERVREIQRIETYATEVGNNTTGIIYFFMEASNFTEEQSVIMNSVQSPSVAPTMAILEGIKQIRKPDESAGYVSPLIYLNLISSEPQKSTFAMYDRLHELFPGRIRFVFEGRLAEQIEQEGDPQYIRHVKLLKEYYAVALNNSLLASARKFYEDFIRSVYDTYSIRQQSLTTQIQSIVHRPNTSGVFVRLGTFHSTIGDIFDNAGYLEQSIYEKELFQGRYVPAVHHELHMLLEQDVLLTDDDWYRAVLRAYLESLIKEHRKFKPFKFSSDQAIYHARRVVEEKLSDSKTLQEFLNSLRGQNKLHQLLVNLALPLLQDQSE